MPDGVNGDPYEALRALRDPATVHPVERGCRHCARPITGASWGTVGRDAEGWTNYVCHTGTVPPQDDPIDCYRLVTVYGEALGSRICNCCTFGNHDTRCTCDGKRCCHPQAYKDYDPAWGHGRST